MKIKIHSFGTPESRDFRCILEGMYRKVGKVTKIEFPDKESIELTIEGVFDYENEYGIHRMERVSPRFDSLWPHRSFAMVEIDGKKRDELVCTYNFNPFEVKNLLAGEKTDDLFGVLGGRPLGLKSLVVAHYVGKENDYVEKASVGSFTFV